MTPTSDPQHTLAVDIGGSGIKVMVLDPAGTPIASRDRTETPNPATPAAVIQAIVSLAQGKTYDRVSVGFPGVVRYGITETAVNLHPTWVGFDLATALIDKLESPVRVINDADMQGLGAMAGTGLELVITLGTGVGSAMFLNGQLIPNLELGHHEFRKGETYEQQLGRNAMDMTGKKKWNDRLEKAIVQLDRVFNYDCLYLGGGNAKEINIKLPKRVQVVPNVAGLLGGIALWRE
ncbi:ROK family protein [Leptolyngbya sp. AN02str]|uniref:ROK family protein n=1 Tax=Leptolyngbya sp. AN02str TaxID=3423363 RepID=UPI003D3209EA